MGESRIAMGVDVCLLGGRSRASDALLVVVRDVLGGEGEDAVVRSTSSQLEKVDLVRKWLRGRGRHERKLVVWDTGSDHQALSHAEQVSLEHLFITEILTQLPEGKSRIIVLLPGSSAHTGVSSLTRILGEHTGQDVRRTEVCRVLAHVLRWRGGASDSVVWSDYFRQLHSLHHRFCEWHFRMPLSRIGHVMSHVEYPVDQLRERLGEFNSLLRHHALEGIESCTTRQSIEIKLANFRDSPYSR